MSQSTDPRSVRSAEPASDDKICELLRGAVALVRGDPGAAVDLAEEAVHLADWSPYPELRAEARLVRGHARRYLGQHEAALYDYRAARQRFARLGRPVDAARTAAGTIDSLATLGQIGAALRLAARARRTFRDHQQPVRAAVLETNLGLVYALHLDDYHRALRLWEGARPVLQRAGQEEDVASLDNNAANALTQLDRLQEALHLYTTARAFYAARQADASVARIDVNLGYLAFRQGRYGAAVDTLRSAAERFDVIGDAPNAVVSRLDLTEVYLALNLLQEATELAREQGQMARDASLPGLAARAAFYLGTALGRAGQLEEALAELERAELLYAEQGNEVWGARCQLGRASLLLAQAVDLAPVGKGEAEPALEKSVALSRTAGRVFARLDLPSRWAGALLLEARAHLTLGATVVAAELGERALTLAQRVGVPWLLFECHYLLGRVRKAHGAPEEAFAEFSRATEFLERVRAEIRPEELRVSLVSDKLDVYQQLVLLCLDRAAAGDPRAHEQALYFVEYAKSRSLVEQMTGSVDPQPDAEVLGEADAHTLARIREVRAELNWLYSRLGEGEKGTGSPRQVRRAPVAHGTSASALDLAHLRQAVAEREAELLRLRRRLEPAGRAQASLLGVAPTAADTRAALVALRRRLVPGCLLLEYFQAGDDIVLFLLDRSRLAVRRIGSAGQITSLLGRFDFQVRKFNLGSEYVARYADVLETAINGVLSELYAALLAPAVAEIHQAKQILVIPHGPLHYVPFHALRAADGQALLDRVEVAYAPSAGVLASCLSRAAGSGQPARPLAMGVPDAQVPHVETELAALRDRFGPYRVFCGGEATERIFRHYAPDADLIHLASHAVFREDNPLFSALRLADGWLAVYDLYRLRLQASLVTLSACETGVSDILAGDEIVGLTRGFFQAGASSLVVSLWAVHDESAARLMPLFYDRLRAGDGPAAAMRFAQQRLREAHRHPYYWAPFLVQGRP